MMGTVPNRFVDLVESLATAVEKEYSEARKHAREHNPQRAGHGGESTWQRLLSSWGPGWPVVTRKYVVGPGGDSKEVDVLVLKPDYPEHLRNEASILASGIAAAFSVKLTLERRHIEEAIEQKRELMHVAGKPRDDVESVLCGHFPFGLLAHSSHVPTRTAGPWATGMARVYNDIAHNPEARLVSHPRDELDVLVVADRCFCSTKRIPLNPASGDTSDPTETWVPESALIEYTMSQELPGTPLVGLFTWLSAKVSGANGGLASLSGLFGPTTGIGIRNLWPRDILPQHMLEHPEHQLLGHGGGIRQF